MKIEVLKSKIHRVKVTGADLDYIGSITIDEALLEAANLIVGEKVSIVNVNNGERFETYIIRGERNSGTITLNGPAARKVQKGDIVIIISYALMDFEEAKTFQPCTPDKQCSQTVCLQRRRCLTCPCPFACPPSPRTRRGSAAS